MRRAPPNPSRPVARGYPPARETTGGKLQRLCSNCQEPVGKGVATCPTCGEATATGKAVGVLVVVFVAAMVIGFLGTCAVIIA